MCPVVHLDRCDDAVLLLVRSYRALIVVIRRWSWRGARGPVTLRGAITLRGIRMLIRIGVWNLSYKGEEGEM